MKTICLCLILLVSGKSIGQNSIEKNIGVFNEIKVFDLINVDMVKSNENKVTIEGKNKSDVEIVNKNGKLKIRMDLDEIYDGNDTKITLYYTSVSTIDANEGAKITVKNVIDQNNIELRAQEGAEIIAQLNTNSAEFRAVTGGIINVNGSSKYQDISILTGGIFNGKKHMTDRTEVSIKAGGEAYIHATEEADVSIRAGGSIFVYGNPKNVIESKVLGGKVKVM
ncbi:head GIN domain-containing protein [Winogradskyella ursingii]|uniref:head GIN domain-containing protein n=1 Tax=Winogradskyella ursingii TaxID=2686079 RepID=UPI0015C9E709|nr:head GIN domain-containing protein [Winogradskyella ursingii]